MALAPQPDPVIQIITFLCATFPIEHRLADHRAQWEGRSWQDVMLGSLTVRSLAAFLSRHPGQALVVHDRCLQILSRSEGDLMARRFFDLLGYHFYEYRGRLTRQSLRR